MQASANIDSKSAKTSLSRRAALGGLAVLAVPTSAAAVCAAPGFAGPEADPIHSAIEAYRTARDFHRRLLDEADKIETAYHEEKRRYWQTLDDRRADAVPPILDMLRETDPATTPDQAFGVLKHVAEEMAATRTNMAECYRLRNEGCDAQHTALETMLQTVPTTTAGLLALADVIEADAEDGGFCIDCFDDQGWMFVDTVRAFLRRMA